MIKTKDAINIANSVRRLFSLLLALPMNFMNVWILDAGSSKPIRFTCLIFDSSHSDYTHTALVGYHFISRNNLWGKILNSYFNLNRKRFEGLWSRIYYYLNSNSAWQYEILNLVSVLDAYCSEVSKKLKKSLPSTDFQLLISKLQQTAKEERDTTYAHLESGNEIFQSILEGIASIKNTTLPTLSEKYFAVFNSLSSEVKEIFNFTEDEFKLLKKIRDATAHALIYNPKNDAEISFEETTAKKLLVVELYFILKDFGLLDYEIVCCFESTFNKIVRSANLNVFNLNKITKRAKAFKLKKQDFIQAKENHLKNPFVLCIKKGARSYYVLDSETSIGINFFRGKVKGFSSITSYYESLFPETSIIYYNYAFVYYSSLEYIYFPGVVVFE